MERYVIINADDFGMCHAHNGATMELLEKGCVTSATIMAPCPWAGEAARFAAARPHLGVGVHLTTTCEWQDYRWGPVTGRAAPSLMDGDGYMWRTGEEFAVHADLGELEKELTAQIERLMGMGLTPSHLDSHMGTMYGLATGRFELLYMAVELAGLHGKGTLLDAYCGVGTIGMIASRDADEVIGVELNPDAVKDAEANARANGIHNISFYANDAGVFLQDLAASGKRPDVILMDPPRTGSTPEFIESACRTKPERIIYVSCNPETLARDLKLFKGFNYRMREAWPFDNFPLTEHIETVCLLTQKS